MPPPSPADVAKLQAGVIKAIAMLHEIRLVITVMLGILLWDCLNCLRREWNLVILPSRRKFTPVTLCYLVTRYFGILALAGDFYVFSWPHTFDLAVCNKAIKWHFSCLAIFYLFANYLLAVRVHSIWERSVPILVILGLSMSAVFVLQVVIPLDIKARQLPPGLRGCVPEKTSSSYWALVTASLIFDVIVLFLALYKELVLWKRGLKSNLIAVLIRDQLVLFVLCCGANLANMLYFAATDDSNNRALLFPVGIGLTSVAACRMVLNIRESAENPDTVLSFTSFTMSGRKKHLSARMPDSPATFRPTFSRDDAATLSPSRMQTFTISKSPKSPISRLPAIQVVVTEEGDGTKTSKLGDGR